jgi:uncharacterized domain HDIG
MKISRNHINYLAFLLTAVLLTALLPDKGKFRYEYQKGQAWAYESLRSPIDFPLLKSDDELRQEREALSQSALPYFSLRNTVEAEQLRRLTQSLSPAPDSTEYFLQFVDYVTEVYHRGMIDTLRYGRLSKDGILVIVQGKESKETPVSEILTPETAEMYIYRMLAGTFGDGEAHVLMQRWRPGRFLAPNLQFDENATMAAQGLQLADIAPIKGRMHTGDLIVSAGEVLTEEKVQILNSLRSEFNRTIGFMGDRYLLELGQFLLMLLCVTGLYIVIRRMYRDILRRYAFLSFILSLMPLVLAAAIFLGDLTRGGLYTIPFAVAALYVSAFFPTRVALVMYLFYLLPVALIAPHGVEWLVLNITAGIIGVYVFHYWYRGWMQFASALVVCLSYMVGYIGFRLAETGSFAGIDWSYMQYFVWNALLIIAVYPVVFLMEYFFGFVSVSRLKELGDTNRTMLQELSKKAPGTMQHALQVASMAEAGAREIGAKALLCRVGALYHDVGKSANPAYFVENQAKGVNPHAGLTPKESAAIILNHVDDGMALAKRHRLPSLVSDFILCHHGKTQTLYFYNQYCNQGGDPSLVEDFTYRGAYPKTREQVVVMLADAVEASTRSLPDYSVEHIAAMVDRVVDERISDKQLAQADISMKEINQVREVFKKHLQGVFHQRISYPERKNNNH